jgi:hypothetical protein
MSVVMTQDATFTAQEWFSPLASALTRLEEHEQHDLSLETLIVHEDMATGLRAKHTLDRLGHGQNKLHLVVKLWTFKVLADCLLYDLAVQDAQDVPILFLSLHGNEELPVTVKGLIDDWSVNGFDKPRALIVSFDANSKDSVPVNATIDHLRAKAIARNIDLFLQFETASTHAWNWSTQTGSSPAVNRQKVPTA